MRKIVQTSSRFKKPSNRIRNTQRYDRKYFVFEVKKEMSLQIETSVTKKTTTDWLTSGHFSVTLISKA